jgi:hypothetical membrane protein
VPRPSKVDHRPRATGASLAAIVLVTVCFGAMVLLHMVRTDLDPVRQVMSEYANGHYGYLMTVAFYAIGLGAIVLAIRLGRAMERRPLAVIVRALLALGGVGLVLAGVFEVERPGIPDTIEEVIHSDATLTAFTLIITAMLLFAITCRRDPRWRDVQGIALGLAVVAALGGAFSPFAGQTPVNGIAQRVLGLAVVSWLALTALHIRLGGFLRSRSVVAAEDVGDLPAEREPS